ncbi:uncharacterized protein LOC141648029 [Silene latifolia]|uniref:uncharacterized protein LOC141648029 n=1 Tax=Silene latifolia TaxID=37657 RepID=UPI003D776801
MEEGDDNQQIPILDNGISKLTGSENNNTDNNSNNNTSNDDDNNNEMGNRSNLSVQQILDMNQELVKSTQELVRRNRAASIKSTISELAPMFFDGKDGDPVKLHRWIWEFEKIFSALECPAEMRVDQAAFYLIENADAWWCNNMERLRKTEYSVGENGEEVLVPFTWDDFKKALKAEFFPKHVRKQKWMEFDNVKQGTLSVQDYYFKFIQLARIVPEMVPSTEESEA